MKEREKLIIGITVGEINGVGLEVILKTFDDSRVLNSCIPIIYGSEKSVDFYKTLLHLDHIKFNTITSAELASNKLINVLNCWDQEIGITPGEPSEETAKCALKALDQSTDDLISGKIHALITGPLDKSTVQGQLDGFRGQTEYVSEKEGSGESLMMLISDNLRIGLATNHIPVKDIAESLSQELIFGKLKVFNHSLKQDFLINKPRIAVLSLNPHSGEGGLMGNEEMEILNPAIEKAKQDKLLVFGPYAADGLFGSKNYKNFDGILAMYHDQGLAPFKAISFGNGVNFTAGLNIIRTSPDHGTAYDLAGKNVADHHSFQSALYTAIDMVRNRMDFNEMFANPLKSKKEKMHEVK